jgi:catechol 2,3-dioxygenase-like lactoylglutathione lyase family enzyme
MPAVKPQLAHVGFLAANLPVMIDFYTRVMGLTLTDRGPHRSGGEIVFLSSSEEEHHQVVLVSGRNDAQHVSIVNQLSFHVDTLEDLKVMHARLVAEKVKELAPRTHGNAWSVYFHDPDGNRLEVYTHSPWYVAQPFAVDIDLTEPVETIRAKTEALVRQYPSFCSREDWVKRFRTASGA